MLEGPDTKTMDTPAALGTVSDAPQQSVQELRDLLQRLQGELKGNADLFTEFANVGRSSAVIDE